MNLANMVLRSLVAGRGPSEEQVYGMELQQLSCELEEEEEEKQEEGEGEVHFVGALFCL